MSKDLDPPGPDYDAYRRQVNLYAQSLPSYPERYVPFIRVAPTSGLAVTSLVLGILGGVPTFSLLALILGGCALPEINRGEKTGKGMAVAGLVLGILGTVGWLWVMVAALAAGGEYPR